MIYQGQNLRVERLADDLAELCFDLPGSRVNTLGKSVLLEFEQALSALEGVQAPIRGLMLTSAKEQFVVGADITEFSMAFAEPEAALLAWLAQVNAMFTRLEQVPYPTLAAIQGVALGGGLELCLACDFRLLGTSARIGLPEVKLGLMPGFGGTVRLPRLIGADNAIEWICSGREADALKALRVGAADAVVSEDDLHEQARALLLRAAEGEIDFHARRATKGAPLHLPAMESLLVFESARAQVKQQAGAHYPAPLAALRQIQKGAGKTAERALEAEASAFVALAKTPVARELIGLFLADQKLKREARSVAGWAPQRAGVLGAGIMGGGIAHQFAVRGVPVVVRDIRLEALDLARTHCAELLQSPLQKRRIAPSEFAATLNRIQATSAVDDLAGVDLVVEAVVERLDIKQQVLAEIEGIVGPDTVLTSNTSTLSVDQMASALQHPERFCGMHFFNPVHRMPLVEVIRGRHSSDRCIEQVVGAARALGKIPVVVNDGPGFLVNRVLFPYLRAFFQLLDEGVAPARIDQCMTAFGWPMGPATLLDVVGLDTAQHAQHVMAQGFPERMQVPEGNLLERMVRAGWLGEKSGCGFYLHAPGQKAAQSNAELGHMLAHAAINPEPDDEEIAQRLMLALCFEAVRCLEEGVAESPEAIDLALVYGIGFPPFLGGALRYLDALGLAAVCRLAERYRHLGMAYQPPALLLQRAGDATAFYPAAQCQGRA